MVIRCSTLLTFPTSPLKLKSLLVLVNAHLTSHVHMKLRTSSMNVLAHEIWMILISMGVPVVKLV
jgi:hypothetical protein